MAQQQRKEERPNVRSGLPEPPDLWVRNAAGVLVPMFQSDEEEHCAERARWVCSVTGLTQVEFRSLILAARGLTHKEAAEVLKRAPDTVGDWIDDGRQKLGGGNMAFCAYLLGWHGVGSPNGAAR